MKKLDVKQPKDVLPKVNLPPPKLEKIKAPEPFNPFAKIPAPSFWEVLWLLIRSSLVNKARDAMDGKTALSLGIFNDAIKQFSPLQLFGAINGWWKLVGIGIVVFLTVGLVAC